MRAAMRFEHVLTNRRVAAHLAENHYLGPAGPQGWAWRDQHGVMVFANPRSRALPHKSWLELVRWCLNGEPNSGSQQWSRFVRWANDFLKHVTTFVSYSDPSQGHTGSLYRACGWLWAPTWHRLRPPPSGNGDWGSGPQAVKDRWVYPLRQDEQRYQRLRITDAGLRGLYGWAEYQEPTWKRGKRQQDGGGDFSRAITLHTGAPTAFRLAMKPLIPACDVVHEVGA